VLFTAAGFVLLALGAIGLALPVWPTTPFVLGAAACFTGAPRIRAWLARLPVFGEHLRNYHNRTGLPRRTVIVSLVFLWGMLALSCALSRRLWLIALLLAVGAAVTAHILWMARPREKTDAKKEETV